MVEEEVEFRDSPTRRLDPAPYTLNPKPQTLNPKP